MRFFGYSRRWPIGVSLGWLPAILTWTLLAPVVFFVWLVRWILAGPEETAFKVLLVVFIIFAILAIGGHT